MSDLTPRQAAFVREYTVDCNAQAAYIRAGYSSASADAHASRLMTDPRIQAAIAQAMAGKEKITGITKAKVVALALEGVEGARQDREWGAYRSAVDLVARLHGYIVEKRDVRVIRGLDDLTDDELAALKASARGASGVPTAH